MMRKTRLTIQALAALAPLSMLPLAAQAATASTTFAVTTTVLTACTVTALPLTFATYDPTAAGNTDGTSTLSVLCTAGTPYNIALDKGTNGASVTTRKMKLVSGADELGYQLFTNSGRTTNWGTTVGTDTLAGTATGLLQAVTVYGRIPAGATVAAGAYTDTVTVTVNY